MLAGWTYAPIVTILAIFLPLYFPTGRLLSPRWRPVLWFGIGFLSFAVAGNALSPGPQPPLPGLAPMPNPVVYLPQAKPLFQLFRNLAAVCVFPGIAGAIAALVVRFRRSRGIERQQLKWFTYAAALAPLPFLAHDFAPSISGLLLTLILPLVPISIGVAILRYRLYEIDRILNRTLVYGLLTVVLGLCYAAGSLVFVLVAGPGADPPSWLVAAATLAAAAIFRPARRRIQAAVDRRFNRRSTTRPRPSRRSPPASATRSTSTPSRPSCWRSWTRPCSQPGSCSGSDPPHPAPRAPLAVRHGQLPGPTEPLIRASGRYQSGCPVSKHLSDGPLVSRIRDCAS
jgi:hypothetical protein